METKNEAKREAAGHTPGPWDCYHDGPSVEPNWHIVTNQSHMRLIANVHIEPGNARDAADARLITAAPELLAALVGLLATAEVVDAGNKARPEIKACGFAPELFARCHAAIARATSGAFGEPAPLAPWQVDDATNGRRRG